MKKIFVLMMLVCITLGANAQSRKLWDFSQGFEQSRANLDADANWTNNLDASGATSYWADATKMYGTLMANGEVIKELEGLTIASTGLKTSSNFKVGPKAFRLSRASMAINLPKLMKGQKVTVTARSANGTATDRGLKTVNDNMTYISGPEGGICLGNQVEGSLGTYTLVWEVTAESADSVEVGVQVLGGGVDFASIMIDDGKTGPSSPAEVAYLYDSSYEGYSYDSDVIPANLASAMNFTPVDLNGATAEGTATFNRDSVFNYDAVIISSGLATSNAFVPTLRNVVNFVPMINFNAYMYEAWSCGQVNTSMTTSLDVDSVSQTDTIYSELEIVDNQIPWANTFITSYLPSVGTMDKDRVVATVEGNPAIVYHGEGRNTYLFIPVDVQMAMGENLGGEAIFTIVKNAVEYIRGSKAKEAQCATPTINYTYENGLTTAALKCSTKDAQIYFSLDGSEPSGLNLYTEPLVFSEPTLIKAVAQADGYNDSKVKSDSVIIKYVAEMPMIDYTRGEPGKTVVEFSTSNPEDVIYYNYTGSDAVNMSSVYTEPIVLTQPATIYAFNTNPDMLNSGLISQALGVDGITADNICLDVDSTAFFTGSKDNWYWETTGGSTKVAYYNTKTASSCYNEDSTLVAYTSFYPQNAGVPSEVEPWAVKTRGQCVQWESTSPLTSIYQGSAGYYAEAAEDLMGNKPSAGFVCFGAKLEGEIYTAVIESTKKFKGPFNIESFVGNNNGNDKTFDFVLDISNDRQNWTTIDTLKYAKTQRLWKRNLSSYTGTDEVYVRFAHVGGNTKIVVYNVNLLYNGPISKQYVDPQFSEVLLGDANADGSVDVADITAIASHILGSTPESFDEVNADANEDSKIDVADITATASIILGGK